MGEISFRDMTLKEKIKFYCSLWLGIVAVLAVFAFVFLIPFVVDPSIGTILADFQPQAVICFTAQHVYTEGLSKCLWSSCKEGCTNVNPRCHQIYVNYSIAPYSTWKKNNPVRFHRTMVKFFVNTDGCGYPPTVNCAEFAKHYGDNSTATTKPFPCHYSRKYPDDKVVAIYDHDETVKNLMFAIGIPNSIFLVSVSILSYLHCWPKSFQRRPPLHVPCPTYNVYGAAKLPEKRKKLGKHVVFENKNYCETYEFEEIRRKNCKKIAD